MQEDVTQKDKERTFEEQVLDELSHLKTHLAAIDKQFDKLDEKFDNCNGKFSSLAEKIDRTLTEEYLMWQAVEAKVDRLIEQFKESTLIFKFYDWFKITRLPDRSALSKRRLPPPFEP